MSEPIVTWRELVAALNAVRARAGERTPLWYFMNRITRDAMGAADEQEKNERRGSK